MEEFAALKNLKKASDDKAALARRGLILRQGERVKYDQITDNFTGAAKRVEAKERGEGADEDPSNKQSDGKIGVEPTDPSHGTAQAGDPSTE